MWSFPVASAKKGHAELIRSGSKRPWQILALMRVAIKKTTVKVHISTTCKTHMQRCQNMALLLTKSSLQVLGLLLEDTRF